MKCKYLYIGILTCSMFPSTIDAQSAFDAYTLGQTELRGTARSMAMAGAFGALGGDLSVLQQNPGGIGIYRSSEIGLTLSWDMQNVTTLDQDRVKTKGTYFNFDNFGYIGSYRTGNDIIPNINWGITYNKAVTFNRHYNGYISNLGTSMTNYVAGQVNQGGWTEDDLGAVSGGYNPYQESYAPWMGILAYNSYLINPDLNGVGFEGLYQNGTTGYGEFEMSEKGNIDEYNLSLGGNIYDILYWGASLGITVLDYDLYAYYGEMLSNASVPYQTAGNGIATTPGQASWGMENIFSMHGNGVNFKFGAIFKPINELRIGVAFHTPTFYSMKSEYSANTSYLFSPNSVTLSSIEGYAVTDEGYIGETWFDYRSPWKFIGSIAAVVGGRGIVSVDYERNMYPNMRISYDGVEDMDVTDCIQQYYKPSNTVRIGAEYKITPQFSVRAGYSYKTSPVSGELKDDQLNVMTAGTTLSYTTDNTVQYITAGLGYRYKGFYIDMAYVHKNRSSDFHAFSPEVMTDGFVASPQTEIKDKNNELVFSIGFKF